MEKLNQMTLIWSNFQVPSGQNSQSWLLPHSQTTAAALVGQHTVLSTLLEISNMWGISQSPDLDMYPHCIPTVCGEMLLVCTSPPLYGRFPWGKTWAGGEPWVPSGNEWEWGVKGVLQSTPPWQPGGTLETMGQMGLVSLGLWWGKAIHRPEGDGAGTGSMLPCNMAWQVFLAWPM